MTIVLGSSLTKQWIAEDRCFWCDKPKNPDADAKDSLVLDYNPCANCRTIMSGGIALYEVKPSTDLNTPEITAGASPTGRWAVVSLDDLLKLFPGANADHIRSTKYAFVDAEIFKIIITPDHKPEHRTKQ